MTSANQDTNSRNPWERFSMRLTNLQTWWLALVGSGFAVAIFVIYQIHRGWPYASQLTIVAAAAIFLAAMVLSTINAERKAGKRDEPAVWLARIRCVIAIGIAALVGFAAAQPTDANPAAIASVGILTAGAAWIAGLLLGFIFGLPQPPAKNNSQGHAAAEAPTNLEHIADWLTKLIIGAGLTQLAQIPGQLDSVASYVGQAMGAVAGKPGWEAYKLFAGATCVFFSLCGFLFGYLWGRLFMPGTFRFDPISADPADLDRQEKPVAAH